MQLSAFRASAFVALHVEAILGFQMLLSSTTTSNIRTFCSNINKIPQNRNTFRVSRFVRKASSNDHGEEPDKTLSFHRSDNGTRDSEFLTERNSGNPFYQIISSLSPGELVGQFINSASPRVQVLEFLAIILSELVFARLSRST